MKKSFLALVVTSALMVGCSVPAANVQNVTLADDKTMADQFMQTAQAFVQSAVGGSGNVQVLIQGDVATLVGYVDNSSTRKKAGAAALRDTRVNSVNNRILVN